MAEEEEQWPALTVPQGSVDITCKYCGRSRFTSPNRLVSLAMATENDTFTIRWRRERGNLCAPCFNFQANKRTPDKFRTHAASCLKTQEYLRVKIKTKS